MANPRVTFSTPPPSELVESSPAAPAENLDEILPTAARAVFKSLAHLIIAPERLTFVDYPVSRGGLCDVYFAKLDENSQTPKDVAVERLLVGPREDRRLRMAIRLARQLKVWEGLRHPNVLELLGYYLSPNCNTAQLISPYMINGGLEQYLARNPVGIGQRLGFVRDITSGLDYLHSHSPPIYHGDLNPANITLDENLNAVLSCLGLASVHGDEDHQSGLTTSTGLQGVIRYFGPELIAEERPKHTPASDVWAWACTAFEVCAHKFRMSRRENDRPRINLENDQILTGDKVFKERRNNVYIIYALMQQEPPASPARLLGLVPEAPKPEFASTLRLLHSYIPICWEYEPRKRPSISLVRQQAFVFSFESDVGDSVVATLEQLADLLIPNERLRLVEHSLGSGNYGEVVLGTLDETSSASRNVAVKRLKAVGTRGERVRLAKRLARELNIWAKIKHPNVVELIGWYLDEKYESPLLISAWMPNGDVLKYMETFKPDIQQRITLIEGITAGLACLHNFEPAICHADLKPANVLIDLHMNAVLCDFGLASFVGDSPTAPGLVTTTALKGGTPRYMSPELHLDDDCTHSLESDVWAWACTVFHVLTGTIPYAKYLGERQLCMAIVREQPPGDIALLLPNNFEHADSESALALQFLHSVIPRCWDFKSQNRPKMCNLLSQMSNLSEETVNAAGRNEDVPSSGSRDETSLPEALRNASGGLTDSGEGAQGANAGSVDVPHDPAPENLLTREQTVPCSSEYGHDDDNDRQVRARPEGDLGSDGRMRDEKERDERIALKAQLLALVAAIDEDTDMRGSQAPHENPIGVQDIRKALGNNWESQLATVLQGIDRHKKNGGTTATPRNFEEKQASQDPVGP
ncbi:hypothetical protein FS837_005343 [Tulasnella sp. UAMH 9824]|nr:hypothetical protein FS837_005343 [Tulasnella sp. UAMH 9824]